mgnify:FL=1
MDAIAREKERQACKTFGTREKERQARKTFEEEKQITEDGFWRRMKWVREEKEALQQEKVKL